MEPEYIAVSEDDAVAVATLQENNAVAVIDLSTKTVVDIKALGYKDHSIPGNGLDASNKDDKINIALYKINGMYQPDAISSFIVEGNQYYVTANEGDAREYDAFIEEFDAKDVRVDASVFGNIDSLFDKEVLGKIDITNTKGDTDGDGKFEELYSYGARSFSVWDENGDLVWDSGDEFEQKSAELYPLYFNSDNDESGELDARSDDKGPEPEAITTGVFNDTTYAFIGLERMGGIMVYNLINPNNPVFETYINDRDYDATDEEKQGDLGPEDIIYIPNASNNKPAIAVSNEVSGTISFYKISESDGTNVNELSGNENVVYLYPNPANRS